MEDWNGVERLSLNRESMRRTTLASIPGGTDEIAAKPVKFRRIAFRAAALRAPHPAHRRLYLRLETPNQLAVRVHQRALGVELSGNGALGF